jgi:hypothetical protein
MSVSLVPETRADLPLTHPLAPQTSAKHAQNPSRYAQTALVHYSAAPAMVVEGTLHTGCGKCSSTAR